MARWTIAAAALLTIAASGSAQSPASDTASAPTIDEVAIARDRYERMTVPVTVGGQGPYRFFIDTGAQSTVVTRRVTDALSLEPSGSAMLVAMGSRRMVPTVELADLEFANRNIAGLVAPLLEGQHIGADGILGLDTLQDMRVLIDFREARMSIADAATENSDSDYEIVVRARRKLGQMIITDAHVNNVRTAVIIDTGSQNSIGNHALLERLRAREDHTLVSTDVNGVDVTSQVALINRLTIGDMDLTGVPIGFAESPAFAALGFADQPAVILGIGNLRIFDRVAIDFASRKILFDLSRSAVVEPFRNQVFFSTRAQS